MSLEKRINHLEQQSSKSTHRSVLDMTDRELYAVIRQDYPDFPDIESLSDSELQEQLEQLQLERSINILNQLADLEVLPPDWQALPLDTLKQHLSGQKRYYPPLPEDTLRDIFGDDYE